MSYFVGPGKLALSDGLRRKITVIRERREKKAEKDRWEALQSKMSAKRLQRMRKVSGTAFMGSSGRCVFGVFG